MRLGALQALDAPGEPAKEREGQRAEHQHAPQVLVGREEAVRPLRHEAREREPGDDAGNQELARSGGEDAEAPEDGGVHGPGHRVAEDLLLEYPDRDEVPEAARNVLPARIVEPSDAQISDEPLDIVGKEADGTDDDEGEDQVRCGHGVLRTECRDSGRRHPACSDQS